MISRELVDFSDKKNVISKQNDSKTIACDLNWLTLIFILSVWWLLIFRKLKIVSGSKNLHFSSRKLTNYLCPDLLIESNFRQTRGHAEEGSSVIEYSSNNAGGQPWFHSEQKRIMYFNYSLKKETRFWLLNWSKPRIIIVFGSWFQTNFRFILAIRCHEELPKSSS